MSCEPVRSIAAKDCPIPSASCEDWRPGRGGGGAADALAATAAREGAEGGGPLWRGVGFGGACTVASAEGDSLRGGVTVGETASGRAREEAAAGAPWELWPGESAEERVGEPNALTPPVGR